MMVTFGRPASGKSARANADGGSYQSDDQPEKVRACLWHVERLQAPGYKSLSEKFARVFHELCGDAVVERQAGCGSQAAKHDVDVT